MLPTRFASVRHKKSPVSTKTSQFRDDTNLVSFRYEKTVPAEPPIHIIPRAQSVRSPSIRTPLRRSASSSTTASSTPSFSPVVVAPPQGSMPLMAPPVEQHPALRVSTPQGKSSMQDWKRDSGAPTSTTLTSPVIPEESFEEEEDCSSTYSDNDGDVCMSDADAVVPALNLKPKAVEAAESTSQVQHIEQSDGADEDDDRAAPASHAPTMATLQGNDGSAATAAAGPRPTTPPPPPAISFDSPTSSTSSPTEQRLSPRKLVKRQASRRASFWGSLRHSDASPPPASLSQSQSEQPMPSTGQPLVRGVSYPTSTTRRHPRTTPATPSRTSLASDHEVDFSPIGITIPTERLLEDDFVDSLRFSNRGSIMFGTEGELGIDGIMEEDLASQQPPSQQDGPDGSSLLTPTQSRIQHDSDSASRLGRTVSPRSLASPTPDIRVLSPDIEMESQKVRSLYETGDGISWEDSTRHSFCERLEPTPEVSAEDDENTPKNDVHLAPNPDPASFTQRSASSLSQHQDLSKHENELAGGLEDWEDVDGAQVDRYGFISMPRLASRVSTPTELKSAQYSPRRRNKLSKRDPMGFQGGQVARRTPSRKVSARSLNTQNSEMSTVSFRSSRSVIRQASNLLPYNRNRRWMDEAGDMLTVSPNLQDVVEEARVEKISEALKKKEWERSEKWRKMAKVVRKGEDGQGMEFEFDAKSPKVIERTWKGIPDRWRGAAWWSFLESSAKEHKEDFGTAEEIIADFHRFQRVGCSDDMQIDLDVPRTISRHIMFRRRYRGGQRLLFRVLHALSLYFPETGYVQGMASLAATLLCYFDEEKCFVMLVRMWQIRGLDRLYQPGFEGLMLALREFESKWLNPQVANRLTNLGVDSTAYGTRWYLTMFNLTIPFPAQLRVWDVFMLLGDGASGVLPVNPVDVKAATASGTATTSAAAAETTTTAKSGLDVIHAASAALIEALREVLLDSDFENAMKALTSWIPIKDEDLLMKVTRAEWKTKQHKKR